MNRKQKKMADLREAKDRKMKKVAIGLSVVLVAVLAFEVPKVLNSGPKSSSTPPAATTTDASATPTGTPTVTPAGSAAAAVTASAASTKLPDSDTLPKVGKAQLYAFGHFAGKDPFVQQVGATQALPGTAGNSSSSASSNQATASQTAKVTIHHPARTLAVTGAARISVNGRVQIVRVGKSFPSANPLFRLVSLSGGVARIGISSGSYSSGAQTVSLVAGRTLTLVDTADGIRYQLRLLS
jgi:hypothetical protein